MAMGEVARCVLNLPRSWLALAAGNDLGLEYKLARDSDFILKGLEMSGFGT